MSAQPVPVLEIGGTHVSAALVDRAAGRVVGQVVRRDLDAAGSATALLDAMATVGRAVGPPGATWGVAMPSPFDYDAGIGRFTGVGKFDALRGVDVRTGLAQRLDAEAVAFGNDADAFGVGEYLAGAAAGCARAVCLTLGTGVGSAWLADGVPVGEGPLVPPEGRVHLLEVRGASLEDLVSRRAIRAAYGGGADVAEIAVRARAGESRGAAVLRDAFTHLGDVLAPWVSGFGAQRVVVGGSIVRSWDLVAPPLEVALGVDVVPAAVPDEAGLLGAAWFTHRRS